MHPCSPAYQNDPEVGPLTQHPRVGGQHQVGSHHVQGPAPQLGRVWYGMVWYYNEVIPLVFYVTVLKNKFSLSYLTFLPQGRVEQDQIVSKV